MLQLNFNETIDQFAMWNSVYWCDHMLRRNYVHVLRRALEAERQAEKSMEEAGWGRRYEGWFDHERCSLPIKVYFLR